MKVIYIPGMPYVHSKDGTKISYVRAGSGPILLLIGGALQTKTDSLMGSLTSLLAQDFTVVSFDRRGRGESGDAGLPAVEREVEDVGALVEELGGDANLFGNSSGGQLALFAATKLSGVRRVAVYEAPFIPESTPGDHLGYLKSLQEALSANKPGDALKAFFKRIGVPAPMVAAMRLTPMWRGLKALASSLPYDAVLVGDGGVHAVFNSIRNPVLALTGDSEPMKQGARRLVDGLPDARHQVLKGQTHAVKPEILASALREFMA